MESKTATTQNVPATVLGSFDVNLLLDPSGVNRLTTTQSRSSSEKVAPEVPRVIGALLFAQQQIRMINDPSRLTATAELAETCRAARNGRLSQPIVPANARTAATYRVELLANGGFRVNVEEKLAGIVSDAAGGLAISALAVEFLTTLREPYRTFYREMLDAAVAFWRERRPSLIESTWVWTLALRRLDQLMRGGVEALGEPQVCANCGVLRPAGFPCLHCESAPGDSGPAEAAITSSVVSSESAEPDSPIGLSEPVAESPVITTASVTVSAAPSSVGEPAAAPVPSPTPTAPPAADPPTTTDERAPERTILPAREMPPAVDEALEAAAKPRKPLAGLLPRGLALVVDLIIGFVLATLGGYGLTAILAASNAFGPGDDPSQFASGAALVFFALYFVLGWTGSETYGMLICRIQVVQEAEQKRCGFFHAVGRGIGYLLLAALGLFIFFIGNQIDNHVLVFIPTGTPADTAIRIIVGLVSLYVVWLGSGQRILGDLARQTWGDKVGKTLVVARQKSA